MGVSSNRIRQSLGGLAKKAQADEPLAGPVTQPAQFLPSNEIRPSVAPPPFQFVAPPQAQSFAPYVTPPRIAGSGTGAQGAFASQRPPGFDPVQAFLASLQPPGQPLAQQPAHNAIVSQEPMRAHERVSRIRPRRRGDHLLDAATGGTDSTRI
jgi:hypothetical protein